MSLFCKEKQIVFIKEQCIKIAYIKQVSTIKYGKIFSSRNDIL